MIVSGFFTGKKVAVIVDEDDMVEVAFFDIIRILFVIGGFGFTRACIGQQEIHGVLKAVKPDDQKLCRIFGPHDPGNVLVSFRASFHRCGELGSNVVNENGDDGIGFSGFRVFKAGHFRVEVAPFSH